MQKVGMRIAPHLQSRSAITAQHIAAKYNIPISEEQPYTLAVDTNGISLLKSPHKPFQLDFHDKELVYKSKHGYTRSDPFIKAFTCKNIPIQETCVLDATAGLGKDSFILSSFGFQMTLLERNPIIYLLLLDAFERAREDLPNFNSIHNENAFEFLENTNILPHVIYLDPMFPKEGKQRATKRNMTFLRDLINVEQEASELPSLVELARRVALKKVIVKRPKYAKIDPNVTHSFSSRDTRFDMFLPTREL